jgi:hypothetical protein
MLHRRLKLEFVDGEAMAEESWGAEYSGGAEVMAHGGRVTRRGAW